MRSLFLCCMLCLFAGSSVFAINNSTENDANIKEDCVILRLSDSTNELLLDLFEGKTPQIILECTEGTILPFSLSLNSEFLKLEEVAHNTKIKLLKTCYIKNVDNLFLFSNDLQNWQGFHKFFTGRLCFNLNVEEASPSVNFLIELNKK